MNFKVKQYSPDFQTVFSLVRDHDFWIVTLNIDAHETLEISNPSISSEFFEVYDIDVLELIEFVGKGSQIREKEDAVRFLLKHI